MSRYDQCSICRTCRGLLKKVYVDQSGTERVPFKLEGSKYECK